jgi:hypothetical protein
VKLAATEAVEPDLTYKDHRLVVRRVGKGWRALIYPPGSAMALRESPATLEHCTREAIIAQAKWVVDARCIAGSRWPRGFLV